MKILILGTAYPYRGGLAAYIERLAKQLLTEGHDTGIFTFTLQYPGFLFPGKSQFTDSPGPADLNIRRIINSINPFNWLRTGLRIRKMRPDLILVKYWNPFMAPCFGTIIRIAGRTKTGNTKVICIFDNVIPHEKSFIDRMLTGYFTGSIDGAIVMSHSVGEDLKKFNVRIPVRFNPHPLYDNYGPLLPREDGLRNLHLEDGWSYLLFFGFIRAYKGLDLLLEAFSDSRFNEMKIRLIVAGEFYESDSPYRDIIERNRIGNRVIILDRFIKEDEVASLFSVADMVVQPYKNATQSGVTQIAYHFGKPMLVTDVGGLSEIVPAGRCGYVVRAEPEAITEALFDFYNSGRKEFFEKGVKEEKAKFTWDRLTASIQAVYNEIK